MILDQQTRNMIFAAASFAALRLEQLTRPDFARTGGPAQLTPREIAVLRLISTRGAARFPRKDAVWESLQPGSSVFLHKGAPKGWWVEYQALARGRFRPLLFLAQTRMDPYTWAEAIQIFEPIGIDRWSDKLFLKYGIRDGLSCPIGAQNREAVEAVGIGEETVRSHVKRAQLKLGVRNRAHAVAEALRQDFIP
jgi:DNA-binding CsgD family transcriptional regulator